MFNSLPPFLYITLAIIAAVISLYLFIRSIRINAHFSAKAMAISYFFLLTIAALRKSIASYFGYLSDYLDILGTIQIALFIIALVMMFIMAFKFGDEKRKSLTIFALIFVIVVFVIYFYLILFYKR